MNTILTYARSNRLLSKVVKAAKEHGYNGDVWADHPQCRYESELNTIAIILIDAKLGDLSPDDRELTKQWATAAVMNHENDSEENRPAFASATPIATSLSAEDLIRRRSAV